MNIVTKILTMMIITSTAFANSNNLEMVDQSEKTPVSINIILSNQETTTGGLVDADASYFYFLNDSDGTSQLIQRNQVQIMETNMDVNLLSLLKGRDPNALTDIIELNDGTRIKSIILDIGTDEIQYFTGKALRRESISTLSIYALHIDNGTISIPFPVSEPDFAVL